MKSIDELIYEETDKRLQEMASRGYRWPKKAGLADVVGIVVVILGCLALIILCMEGVIL